ncbi:MAG: sigma factor, partial [Fulvivirga sp.]|nr:sigma factor [Fulvivirga sp.]
MDKEKHYIIDHFFRHEYGRTVSILTKRFGTQNFDHIEDAVQEAMVKAMQVWPYKGVPQNPSSWIFKTAQNKLLDQLRRVMMTEKKNRA